MSKHIYRQKIARYNDYIRALSGEKIALEKLLLSGSLNELQTARAKQRLFELDVTTEGHTAFIKEYQDRLNPGVYRKRIE